MNLSIKANDTGPLYPDEPEGEEYDIYSDRYYENIGYGSLKKVLEPGDLIITVEHCCNCEMHNMISLRHDSSKYIDTAHSILKSSAKIVHGCNLNIRLGVARLPILGHMRYGAFEVNAIYKDRNGEIHSQLLHSKLESSFWPSKYILRRNLKAFLNDCKIAVNEDEQQVQEPWHEMRLCEDHWTIQDTEEAFCIPAKVPVYQSLTRSASSPFPILSKSTKTLSPMKQRPSSPSKNSSTQGFTDNGDIVWVFDSKEEEDSGFLFEVKSLPPVDAKIPSHDLIRARIDTFGGSCPSDSIACGAVESFEITEEDLSNEIEGELLRRITQHKYSQLSAAIAKHSGIFKIEAMALPATGSSGHTGPDAPAALVKFRITFERSWDLTFDTVGDTSKSNVNLGWFGLNTIYIGSPEGDIIGIFAVNIGPPLEQLPALSQVFSDPISKEPIISRMTVHLSDDKDLVKTQALVEDGVMYWSNFNIPSGFTGFLKVDIESLDFEQWSTTVFYSMGLLNLRQESAHATLQRKLLPDLMEAAPSAQLLAVSSDHVVALPQRVGGVVEYAKAGTVTFYQVTREMWKQIRASKCELWKRMCRNTKSVVSVLLMNEDSSPCKDLHVFAMAEPSPNGEHRRIGPTIKILLNANVPNGKQSNTLKHYGRKILLIGGPDGILFDSFVVDVQPPIGSPIAQILSKTNVPKLSWEKEEDKGDEGGVSLNLISCGEPMAFAIEYSKLPVEEKELIWQLRDRQLGKYFVRVEINSQRTEDDSAGPSHNLLIEAVALSNPASSFSFIVRMQVTIDPTSPSSAKYNLNNYGPKVVSLYGVSGMKGLPIFEGVVEVLPEFCLRPGRHYELHHSLLSVPLEMDCSATITKIDAEESTAIYFEGYQTIDLPCIEEPGIYNITFSADSFDDQTLKVIQYGNTKSVIASKKMNMNPTGSLSGGDIRVMLSWDSNPSELDLHCLDEIKYLKQQEDHDEHAHGAGAASRIFPEVMTLKIERNTRYSFYVHNYSGIGCLSTSQATLRVLGLPGDEEVIHIPAGVCEPYERKEGIWNAFYIDENGFTLVNEIIKQPALEKFHKALFTR